MHLFLAEHFKSVGIVLDLGHFLFLRLLDLELFFGCWGRVFGLHFLFSLRFFLSIFLLSRRWRRFDIFFLRNFCLFSPFLNQVAIIKNNDPIVCIFKFKLDTKCVFLWILSFGNIVANMLPKSNNCRFILDKDFDCLFAGELDSFARWNLASCVKDHFPLLLRIL